jgi:hypothetical protein
VARDVRVAILGDSRDFTRAVKQAQGDVDRLNGKFRSVGGGIARFGKAAAIGIGAIGVGAVALGKSFVDAAVESQKVTKQTEAVIKSMGGVANVTAKQVARLSERLSMQTGVDDELIQSGQNLLLTFGNIRNEVGKSNDIFNQATSAALDMSVAMGTDMKSASIQVGKALNNPIKGVTALTRAGVSFSESQKATIKRLVESGRTLDAQKLILAELDKQFGGSAKAQATAGERLRVVWGNMQERLGEKLLPIVEKVATFLANNLPKALDAAGRAFGPIARNIGAFFKALFTGFTEDEGTAVERAALGIRDAFMALADFIQRRVVPVVQTITKFMFDHKEVLLGVGAAVATVLVAAFVSWATAAAAAAAATIAAAAPLLAIAAAVGVVAAAVVYAYKHWGWFKSTVDAVARFLRDKLLPAFQAIWRVITGQVIPAIGTLIRWHATVISSVANLASNVRNAWQSIIDKVRGVAAGIRDAVAGAVNFVREKFQQGRAAVGAVWDWIVAKVRWARDIVVSTVDRMLGPIDEVLGKLGDIGSGIGGAIGSGINKGADLLGFDTGGTVPGPIGKPRLAVVHGGETVLPTHRQPRMLASANTGGDTNVTIYMPPGSDGEDVINAIKRWERRNGTGWRN